MGGYKSHSQEHLQSSPFTRLVDSLSGCVALTVASALLATNAGRTEARMLKPGARVERTVRQPMGDVFILYICGRAKTSRGGERNLHYRESDNNEMSTTTRGRPPTPLPPHRASVAIPHIARST